MCNEQKKAEVPLCSVESFDQAKIDHHLNSALQRLKINDRLLFTHNVNERSICFRLGLYLQEEFPSFTVDCEYNRNHEDRKFKKRLSDDKLNKMADVYRGHRLKSGSDFLSVYPDIIVHRRDTNDNLLVIETKKTTSKVSDAFDRQKLLVYCKALKYRFAKFIRFRADPTGEEDIIVDNDSIQINLKA